MDKYIYKRKAFNKEQCEQLIKAFENNDLRIKVIKNLSIPPALLFSVKNIIFI